MEIIKMLLENQMVIHIERVGTTSIEDPQSGEERVNFSCLLRTDNGEGISGRGSSESSYDEAILNALCEIAGKANREIKEAYKRLDEARESAYETQEEMDKIELDLVRLQASLIARAEENEKISLKDLIGAIDRMFPGLQRMLEKDTDILAQHGDPLSPGASPECTIEIEDTEE